MRLYEYQGKALLVQHGVSVPEGAVWPELPEVSGPLVVKAQVLGGGRGKLGGIRFVVGKEACAGAAVNLLGSRLGEHDVRVVYVEERLEIASELYVAILVDRESQSPLLLASKRGGIEVEKTPDSEMLRLGVDPLLGLRPFALRRVISWLGLTGEIAERAVAAIKGMYEAFKSAEAELVEINPLVVTADGRVIAADAKVILDDDAGFRHPERQSGPEDGTAFERLCAANGTVGIEMDGDVAIVVSGAGLMMATIDLLSAGGASLRAAVDLTGMAFGTPAQLAKVVRLVISLSPKVVFINAFFNLAFCDQLAQGVADGFRDQPFGGRVAIRLKGRRLPEAKAILAPFGFRLFDELPEAIEGVIKLAKEAHPSPS